MGMGVVTSECFARLVVLCVFVEVCSIVLKMSPTLVQELCGATALLCFYSSPFS